MSCPPEQQKLRWQSCCVLQMNDVVGEMKEKERFGEIAPVAVPPKLRLELESEREDILERLQVSKHGKKCLTYYQQHQFHRSYA